VFIMSSIRLAIIGSRGHADTVLRELESVSTTRLVAMADGGDHVIPIQQWCERNGVAARQFIDHRKMLDHVKPDAVVVCGPFEQHARMTIDAMERGIHVMTEKPAALTDDGLDALRNAVDRYPSVHLAGMMFSRYAPGFYAAKQLIASGAIGDVRLINARKSYKLGTRGAYYHDRETYGGTIPWVGSHAIDWVAWLGGHTFKSVYAMHSAVHNGGCGTMERSALCQFAMCGERAASVSIDLFRPSTANTHGDDWVRVVGTTGTLEATPTSLKLVNEAAQGLQDLPVACPRRPLADFIDHVEGRATALIDASDTLALTEACLNARRSADERRVIQFQPRQDAGHRRIESEVGVAV
jgi:predicted dehydrogenase